MNDVESGHSATPSSISIEEGGVPTKIPLGNEKNNKQTDPELAASTDQAHSQEPYLPRAFANNLAAMVSTPRTKAPKDALKAVYLAGWQESTRLL
jgi:hypothetical protein